MVRILYALVDGFPLRPVDEYRDGGYRPAVSRDGLVRPRLLLVSVPEQLQTGALPQVGGRKRAADGLFRPDADES